jgi:hypothetical protein
MLALAFKGPIVDASGTAMPVGEQEREYFQNQARKEAYETLLKISPNFTIAAAFGNVHGVYKPGNVKLKPVILKNSQDYIELKTKDKVNFYKTPDAILRAQLAAWDKVIAAKSGENPLFKKVLDSQKAFAQRAGEWQNDYMVDFKMAWNHYFRRPAAGQKKA